MYVGSTVKGFGRYRGMGQAGPLYTCPTGEQVFSSSDCPGGQPAPDVQQQIADLWSQVTGSNVGLSVPAASGAPGSFTYWLNSNGQKVALIGGSFLAVLLLVKAMR